TCSSSDAGRRSRRATAARRSGPWRNPSRQESHEAVEWQRKGTSIMGAGHDHGAGRTANSRRLAITLGLVTLYMVAEVVGGLLTNSLALLADAGHMLSDAGALALSLFAIWLAARPARSSYTYGYYRTEILAALVNGATLVAISIFIFLEAFKRIGEPPEVQGALMMGIATGGLVVNLVGLWILNAG